jgi:hypothetical protein
LVTSGVKAENVGRLLTTPLDPSVADVLLRRNTGCENRAGGTRVLQTWQYTLFDRFQPSLAATSADKSARSRTTRG